MSIIRSTIFYFFFYFGTSIFFLFFSPVKFFSTKFVIKLSVIWTTSVISLARKVLNINYCIKGKENIPDSRPFIVASNHQSAWETFFFGSFFPGSVFILKHELKKIPILSQYFKKLGFIFIKREKKIYSLKNTLSSIRKLLEEGKKIFVIFPEGTRMKPGEKIKLNTGVFAIHKMFKIPILPVRLNSGEAWINKSYLKKNGVIEIKFFPIINNLNNKEELMKILEKTYY